MLSPCMMKGKVDETSEGGLKEECLMESNTTISFASVLEVVGVHDRESLEKLPGSER